MQNLRLLLYLLLPLHALDATAQCCCSDIPLVISLEKVPWLQSEQEFVIAAGETGAWYRSDRDSTDRELHFLLDAGCGIAVRRVFVTRTTTGETMELHVYFVGFDGWHSGLRVPFLPGSYAVDFERLTACADRRSDHDRKALAGTREEVSCASCRLLVQRDSTGVMIEPMDLCCGACSPGNAFDRTVDKAFYSPGQQALEEAVMTEMARRGGKLHRSLSLSGTGRVNEQGSIHVRMDQAQTKEVYALEMAMMGMEGWSPARITDPEAPEGWRTVPSMVRFVLEP